MRHTKIVATVGPASSSPETIQALIKAGVDVFRLNFSHGTHESHAELCTRIRSASRIADRHVGIMQDLSGPKIRTGPLAGNEPVRLAQGEPILVRAGDLPSTTEAIYTPYAELVRSARPGDRLLLDDGRIELRIVAARPDVLEAVVVNGGLLGSYKGINAPGVPLPASSLTAKDAVDLRFGLELGVDFVALSFVQTAEDVRRAKSVMESAGRSAPLIAKIERPAAVQNLAQILDEAYGVMVARGDLGLEMPLEQVPRIQKEIIRRARALGRPSILATQVLESMRVEPRPTRAEVSDAANAVDEGADAIMLAGETAVGAFPVRAVETLDAVIRDAELMPTVEHVLPIVDTTGSLHARALCEAAVTLAAAGHADAIVAITHEGKTARLLASLRPGAPIIATTPEHRVAASLTLVRGVHPVVSTELDIVRVQAELVQRGLLNRGALVVFINVSPQLDRSETNFLNVQKV
jgi:pyruvate kinase